MNVTIEYCVPCGHLDRAIDQQVAAWSPARQPAATLGSNRGGSDQRLDADHGLGHAEDAGVDADLDDLRGALALVGDHHRRAVEQGVFGSSTIVFGSGRGSFVRFADAPDVEAGPAVLAALRTLAEDARGLDHLEPLRR